MTSIGLLIRLEELVPPPENPMRGDGDWKRFWSVNGFQPPEDYRMLIREYGAGTFAGWLRLIEPFHHTTTFMELAEVECRTLRAGPNAAGWPIWPETGGFLPWAVTANGDHVGWRTDRGHKDWTTAYWGKGGRGNTEFDLDAIGFLVALAEGTLTPPSDGSVNPFTRSRQPFLPTPE